MKYNHAFLGDVTMLNYEDGVNFDSLDPDQMVVVVDRFGEQVSARVRTLIPIEETPPASTGSLNDLADEITENNIAKGWYTPGTERNFGESMMLVVSELAEALEHFRDGREVDEVFFENGKPDGVPIEVADAIIRLLGFSAENGIDIDRAVRTKMEYNKTRPYRHGGKRV